MWCSSNFEVSFIQQSIWFQKKQIKFSDPLPSPPPQKKITSNGMTTFDCSKLKADRLYHVTVQRSKPCQKNGFGISMHQRKPVKLNFKWIQPKIFMKATIYHLGHAPLFNPPFFYLFASIHLEIPKGTSSRNLPKGTESKTGSLYEVIAITHLNKCVPLDIFLPFIIKLLLRSWLTCSRNY